MQWIFLIFNWLSFESKKKKKEFSFEVSVFHLFIYLLVWKDTKKTDETNVSKGTKDEKIFTPFYFILFFTNMYRIDFKSHEIIFIIL